jgi:hypothetical protein
MNEISLKLETRVVEAKTISTRFKIVVGEPVFGMSQSAYNWFITKIKNENFVSRLKNRSL